MTILSRKLRWITALCAVALCVGAGPVQEPAPQPATRDTVVVPAQIRGLDVKEHLNQPLPLDVAFTNSEGKEILLNEYFTANNNKPAIIAMVYFDCPVVCSLVMERLAETLKQVDLTVGKDFRVLLFSFNPRETTKQAHDLKELYLAGYETNGRKVTDETRKCWEFHTSTASSRRRLGDALGFEYRALDNGQYSHPVVLFMATPDGRISRYVYGFDYPARDVKLALMESASGRITPTLGDRILNFCYLYDPTIGRYTASAVRIMQVFGILTFLALASLIGVLLVGERILKKKRAAQARPAPGVDVITVKDATGVQTGMAS